MAVGDRTAYSIKIATIGISHTNTVGVGVADFETPAALGDTAVAGIYDISAYRDVSITIFEDNNNALTAYIYVSNQPLQPSTTYATMVTQMHEITGGVACAQNTTTDVLLIENNAETRASLKAARWGAIAVIDGAGSSTIRVDCVLKS